MRRDQGESVDPNDSGPVGVIATPPGAAKPKLAEVGENELQKKSIENSSVDSPMVPTTTIAEPNATIRHHSTVQNKTIIGSDAKIPANSNSFATAALSGDEMNATAASEMNKQQKYERVAKSDANEKAAALKARTAMMKHCEDAVDADKKQQANVIVNYKTSNDDKLDGGKASNRNCSEMAMQPEIAKAAVAAANGNNNTPMERESSSQSQTPGCETGETGHEKKMPKQNPPSNPTAALAGTEPFVRKRGRHFLWKETSNSSPRSLKKTKLHHDGAAETINKSNWGKLREQLFRFVRPQISQNEDTQASVPVRVDSLPALETNGLLAMHEILVSPYEGNRSAEIGEEPLDRWKELMKPIGDNEMNPLLSDLYGDPLAKTIFSAKIEIASLEHLFETSWKWGKVGSLTLGWIPRRQLLLCLDEDKIMSPTTVATPVAKQYNTRNDTEDSEADDDSDEKSNDDNDGHGDGDDEEEKEKDSKSEDEEDEEEVDDDDDEEEVDDDEEEDDDERDSETEALRKVARKLECFELVIAAMREWKFKYEYPELYSCKGVGEYIFRKIESDKESNHGSESGTSNGDDNETKKNCYKCLIFVARVFCALLLFNEEQKAPSSLMQKVRACLAIMNTHARAHPTELARILKKKKRKEEGPKPKTARKRRTKTILGNVEEREATLMASFGHVKRESETLLKMMDYYKTRLLLVTPEKNDDNDDSDGDDDEEHNSSHFHRHISFMESMEEEIVSNAKREFVRERRFRKKVALARQNISKL